MDRAGVPSRAPVAAGSAAATLAVPNSPGVTRGTAADTLVLLAAGGVAGVVGTAGGITSLVSYPALLWVGIAISLA